jgi:hypothetical protein
MRTPLRLILLSVFLCTRLTAPAAARDDDYLRGYVAAIVERELNISADAVDVHRGIVSIHADLSPADEERLRKVLLEVEGIEDIVVIPADTQLPGLVWFPERSLFTPLLADPRWPHFSLSYQYYIDDDDLTHVAAPNFGELFPLLHYAPQYGGSWEVGIQGGVFAIFDLASDSFDLINADYRVALPVTYAWGGWAAMLRFFHQSSHLGDEYLLRENNGNNRINVSYEGLHLLLSRDLPYGFRLYGGGGYLVHVDPESLDRGSVQTGIEFAGNDLDLGFGIPVAGVDLQFEEEGNWRPNVSPRAGLQFGEPFGLGRNLQVLVEYFDGKSPNGQFYDRTIRYIGFGAHLHF